MNLAIVLLGSFVGVLVVTVIVVTSLYCSKKTDKNQSNEEEESNFQIDNGDHAVESVVHFLEPEVKFNEFNNMYSIDLQKHSNGILTYMEKRYFAFFILTGGLGDILRHLFASGIGKTLNNMKKPALVFFNTHNSPESMKNLCQQFPSHHDFHCLPFSEDLFATYVTLSDMKKIGDHFRNRMYDTYNTLYTQLYDTRFELFSYEKDFINISEKSNVDPYIVLQRCAGTRDRDIPLDLCRKLVTHLNNRGINVVHIGKNYERSFVPSWSESLNETHNYKENKYDVPLFNESSMYVFNVDKLSVTESRKCILHSCGIITPFSSASLSAMEFNIPVLTIVMLDLAKHINLLHFTDDNINSFWGGLEYVNSPERFRYSLLNIYSEKQEEFVKSQKAHIEIDFTKKHSVDKALQHLYP